MTEENQAIGSSVPTENAPSNTISPIDEAKNILEQNKKLLGEMKAERERMEKTHAEFLLAGKSMAGAPIKSPAEIQAEEVQAEAKRIASRYL